MQFTCWTWPGLKSCGHSESKSDDTTAATTRTTTTTAKYESSNELVIYYAPSWRGLINGQRIGSDRIESGHVSAYRTRPFIDSISPN